MTGTLSPDMWSVVLSFASCMWLSKKNWCQAFVDKGFLISKIIHSVTTVRSLWGESWLDNSSLNSNTAWAVTHRHRGSTSQLPTQVHQKGRPVTRQRKEPLTSERGGRAVFDMTAELDDEKCGPGGQPGHQYGPTTHCVSWRQAT